MSSPFHPVDSVLQSALEMWNLHGESLIVGVSGGADSVALLRGLVELAEPAQLRILVAHLDHGLRENSARDAQWVEELCRRLHVEFLTERVQLEGIPGTVEERARSARYAFFTRLAQVHRIRIVAVAHTADDQVETVLHQLLRGSGLKGLSGIPASRDLGEGVTLIRPLLSVTRAELEGSLAALGQEFLIDPTNDSRDFTRNRIRHDLLPLLREQFNPRVGDALLRLSQQARETQQVMESAARKLWEELHLEKEAAAVRLRTCPDAGTRRAVVREMLVQIWEQQGWPRQALSFEHLDQLADMAISGDPPAIDLPGGVQANVRRSVLTLQRLPRTPP